MNTSTPIPVNNGCVQREDWDRCIRQGIWRVAPGIVLGAIGSAFLVSEVPAAVGAGLGIAWAVQHCKKLINVQPPQQNQVLDPCSCCHSDFEALDKFEMGQEQTRSEVPTPPAAATDQSGPSYPSEEKCTCNEMATNWSVPKPAEPFSCHPSECSCNQ